MAEPSRRASRLTIAAATLATVTVGAVGFVLGRSTREPRPPTPMAAPAASAPAPTPTRALPTVEPPLGRAELIAAANNAADAYAAGRPLPENVAALAGREFELRLPFACPGVPQPTGGALEVEYDEAAEALRVRAEPVRWAPEKWLPSPADSADGAPAVESIEGFWIARPWTSTEACPAPAAGNLSAPVAAEQTLAIVQVFTPEGSRVGRRDGEAYSAVESVATDALNTSGGLQLRLRGKLAKTLGAGPILCRTPVGTRPVCMLLASFDQVAIDNPATGTTIATWDVSSQAAASRGR